MNPIRPAGPAGPAAEDNRIAPLLREIADLAASPVPENVFLQELLKRAVEALEAQAGVIWMYDAERRLVLACEVRLATTGFLEDPAFRAAFERPFGEVLQSGGVVAHEAEQATLRDGIRHHWALLGGLQRETQVSGVLQLFEPPSAEAAGRPERLRVLEHICGQAARYWIHRSAHAEPSEPAAAGTAPAEQWTLALFDSLKTAEVAAVAANECRRLLAVDRVSVAERHGPRVKILAVSGQPSVNARSNVIRLLSRLSEQVIDTGEKLTFDGDTRNLPPQIEKLLADYLHESRSRAMVVLPVSGPDPHEKQKGSATEADERDKKKPPAVGVMIVEQISEAPFPADLDARLDRLAAHVGLALRNAQTYEKIFLHSLWAFLGNWKAKLKGRRTWQVAAGLAAAAVLALALVIVPWDYRVVGKGKLMPVERRGIFAPWNGEVTELPVRSGQKVEKGALLLTLKNDEMQANLLKQRNLLQEKKQHMLSIAAQLNEAAAAANPMTQGELHAKYGQLEIEVKGAEEQVNLITKQVESLSIRAPISGVITTFRIEEMLRERPVKQGDLLLEVMDPAGPWRLELDVPENRLGHILTAQEKVADGRLPVRYVLATATELRYDGSLDAISTRSVVSETEGSVVPLYASLAEPTPPEPRVGAEVTAKINCGPRSLGYVLFGDVIEFVRKKFWF
jgi:multidrug efflux pump subunit AcrA (membrane-fusion protein)